MEEILAMEHITKTYPGVKALDDVSISFIQGEVHAVMGENGAGKSTLMKILNGMIPADSGDIRFHGEKVAIRNPRDARALGIAMIHQELNPIKDLTVAENMFVGRYPQKGCFVDWSTMYDECRKLFEHWKVDFDPKQKVRTLSTAETQMLEILKAISYDAKLIIMDEPTSALTSKEIDDLFVIIHKLRDEGCGIVYISHRLEELQHIVDRVTIMRDGQYITTMNFADTTIDQIITHMVGREIKEKFPRVTCEKGKKIFEVKNLNAGRMVRNISFSLYEGEIVGFAGLMGAGRTETTRAIFGIDPKQSGQIFLDGREIAIHSPADAIRQGVVLAPEDRKKDGLCTKLSIRHNIALPNLDLLCNRLGVVSHSRENAMCDRAVRNLQIKTPSLDVDAANLSGGNQQKVVVAKWLARNSRVVLFDEPTRGIDVAAKVEIYHLMNQLKQQGIAVMFVSSELPEVLGIADRVIVMCDGQITGEVMARETTQNEILTLATRFENKMAAGQ